MQLETLTAQTSRAHAGAPVHVDPLGRVDTRNAALMLGRSPGTVSNWRVQGIGPKHFTVNGRCYYWANEVAAYGRGEAA